LDVRQNNKSWNCLISHTTQARILTALSNGIMQVAIVVGELM
jgi:hypothetical protein